MKSVIFLASSNGANLRFCFHAIKLLRLPISISMVIADRSCGAIDFANKQRIPNSVIQYASANPGGLDEILQKEQPSIVITNIHKILAVSTLSLNHNYINLHYSLLPAFKGLIGMAPVNEAEKLKCPFIGVSTHELSEEVDSGPLIQQGLFHVDWSLPKNEIFDTVFKTGCLVLLNSLLGGPTERAMEKLIINSQEVCFSEALRFESELLTKRGVWQMISDDTI